LRGTWNKIYRLYEDTASPYTNSGGTLVATIEPVTSANPSQTFSNLSAGCYYVIVTDANGCTSTTSVKSTFALDEGGGIGTTMKVASCLPGGGTYYVHSHNGCENGLEVILSNGGSWSLGDVVQMIQTPCSSEASTFCGTIQDLDVTETINAVITMDQDLENCSNFNCFE
jgi:hypothetical protein